MMSFLQRIINGGGNISREYAINNCRVDLYIVWPYANNKKQRIVIELKVLRSKNTLAEGLQQTADYMDGTGADEGHLIIFDKDMTKKWQEKTYCKIEEFDGETITVWGV